MLDQEIDGINKTYDHADQQVGKKNGKNRYKKWHKLLPALPVYREYHFWFCKIVTGTYKDQPQYTIWDKIN